jgi:hypothetical protein
MFAGGIDCRNTMLRAANHAADGEKPSGTTMSK